MPKGKKLKWREVQLRPVIEHEELNDNGEPEHFKYGVFYDDGYDYMQHFRSRYEDATFEIVFDDEQPVSRNKPTDVFPDSDDEELPPEVEVPSDEDFWDDVSEIEDNFMELAGGAKTKDEKKCVTGNTSEFSMDKVIMMERFLWGDNEERPKLGDFQLSREHDGASTVASSMRKGRPLTDQEEIAEHQFLRTLEKTKSASNDRGAMSVVTGVSMLSQQLDNVVLQDSEIWQRLAPKSDTAVCPLDETEKKEFCTFLKHQVETTPEQDDEAMEEAVTKWIGEKRKKGTDISTVVSSTANFIRKPQNLEMPKGPAKQPVEDKPSKMEAIAEQPPLVKPDFTRDRNETAEEKRARKAALKEYKRQRTEQRKVNRNLFAAESARIAQSNTAKSLIRLER